MATQTDNLEKRARSIVKVPTQALPSHRRVLEWRIKGKDIASIAKGLGITPRQTRRMLERILEANHRETVDSARRLELARLDNMLEAVWPRVRSKDDWAKATDIIIKIMALKARLLGLEQQVVDTRVTVDTGVKSLKEFLHAPDNTPPATTDAPIDPEPRDEAEAS